MTSFQFDRWEVLDENDKPEPLDVQAKFYLDKNFDLEMKRSEKLGLALQEGPQPRQLPPSPLQPPPPPPPPAGGSGTSMLGRRSSGRRQLGDAFDAFDDAGPSQGSPSLLHTKKKQKPAYAPPSVGASRADGKAPASGGSARESMPSCGGAVRTASHNESETWSPYLEVQGEISFEEIVEWLRSPEGVTWKKTFNIVHVATAKELLQW